MRKLLSIPADDGTGAEVLESGIAPSLAPNQQKLWLDGSNVLPVDLSVQKAKGVQLIATLGETITGMAQSFVEGDRRVYLGTDTHIFRYADETTANLMGTFTGGHWSMIPWGTWLLATNDIDPVQVCKDTNVMAALANVPVTHARVIRKLAQRPIIFYGQEAAWPRATDIEAWATPDPTGNAGSYFIRDLDSDVTAVEEFGEQLAFYTRNRMGFVSFIGGNAVYGFKRRLEGIGAIGLNAVIPVGALHYGMGVNGMWMTDGSSYRYTDNPFVNRMFDTHIDKSLGDDVVGVHIKDRSTVAWFFVGPDAQRHGFGFNYAANGGRGAWTHLHFPVTAAAPQEVYDCPLAAVGMSWGLLDSTNDLAGTTMPSSLTTGAFDAGQPNRYKWWDMVELELEASGLVEIRFGLHKRPTFGEDINDEHTAWVTAGKYNEIKREAVYLTAELRSTAANVSWRLGGLAVHGEMAGWVL